MIQDKNSIIQVLGGLLNNPSLLSETDRYQLEQSDFPERFHKIIFGVINNLYHHSGIEEIGKPDIDGFLREYDVQYDVFNQNNGLEYIDKVQELSKEGNFDYYYERLKKFSLVREMKSLGFDVSEVYDETILNPRKSEELQEKFDKMSVKDILNIYEEKIVEIKEKFESNSEARGIQAGEGIIDLLDSLEESPDIGIPLNSPMLTSIVAGARKQRFFIRSSYSGGGKTRSLVGDSMRISAKGWYDSTKGEWVRNEFEENSVVISTEMTFEELQTIAIAYIADVDEDKIIFNTLNDEERERVRYAANILKESNAYLEHLPNFSIEDIERVIVKNIIRNKVEYVMFDYIHSSIEILSSFTRNSGIRLREDQILLLMADRLKQIANKHEVFLFSATQLNDGWKEAQRKGIDIDDAFIQGSKSVINKTDVSCIMLPVSDREKKELDKIIKNGFPYVEPNVVTHLFKNRGNRHTKVKIFSHVNMGTMRIKDLFTTDYDNKVLNIEELVIKRKDKAE